MTTSIRRKKGQTDNNSCRVSEEEENKFNNTDLNLVSSESDCISIQSDVESKHHSRHKTNTNQVKRN